MSFVSTDTLISPRVVLCAALEACLQLGLSQRQALSPCSAGAHVGIRGPWARQAHVCGGHTLPSSTSAPETDRESLGMYVHLLMSGQMETCLSINEAIKSKDKHLDHVLEGGKITWKGTCAQAEALQE